MKRLIGVQKQIGELQGFGMGMKNEQGKVVKQGNSHRRDRVYSHGSRTELRGTATQRLNSMFE